MFVQGGGNTADFDRQLETAKAKAVRIELQASARELTSVYILEGVVRLSQTHSQFEKYELDAFAPHSPVASLCVAAARTQVSTAFSLCMTGVAGGSASCRDQAKAKMAQLGGGVGHSGNASMSDGALDLAVRMGGEAAVKDAIDGCVVASASNTPEACQVRAKRVLEATTRRSYTGAEFLDTINSMNRKTIGALFETCTGDDRANCAAAAEGVYVDRMRRGHRREVEKEKKTLTRGGKCMLACCIELNACHNECHVLLVVLVSVGLLLT